MLLNLHVKNMALLREEEVAFGPGLNILTGETGAGKSVIIGSVTVALGTGNFKDYVRDENSEALVELIFESSDPKVLEALAGQDIPADDNLVVISRKYRNGRSISRVNGESVTTAFVREIASLLIDIHGQHEHQSLLHPGFHLELLDRYASDRLKDLPEKCRQQWEACRALERELSESVTDLSERTRTIDLLTYEIGEIEEADLKPGEDELLEEQYRRMENGQRIMEALGEADRLAGSGSETSDNISRAVREILSVSSFDRQLSDLGDQIAQIEDLLNDFGRSVRGCMDDLSYDEQAYYETGRRLDQINHLKSKYGKTLGDIEKALSGRREKLEKLQDYEGYLESLNKKKAEADRLLAETAEQISRIRKECAKPLEEKIRRALADLNFPDVRFSVHFEELAQPGSSGRDHVEFLISLNPGMPVRALREVASGGELSRIMLAIKSVMADQDAVGTLIFDEIDTGISGRTAQKVSEKMAVIASSHQVICITHLAQIAAMADTHFEIRKETDGKTTSTHIRQLDEEDSILELARILGGAKITDAVTGSAREMKSLANALKTEKEKNS